jgi:hypothetical protein
MSGDTLVAGAYTEDGSATGVNGSDDNNAFDSGAAYVFNRSGTTWSQQAYLKASNTEAGDNFGGYVAIDADTVGVGAWFEDSSATGVDGNQADNSAPSAGAAYVYARSGTTWTQQAYLKASNTGAQDSFSSVSISGDTMVVGAYAEDSSATGVNGNQANNTATDSGAAYAFTRTGTTWTQQAYVKASNTGANDYFGGSVAIDADTVGVGAWPEDSSATGVNGNQANDTATNSGAAYVLVPALASYQPDGRIKKGTSPYVGNDVYNTDGTNQTRTGQAARGNTIKFTISIQNDGDTEDNFSVQATGAAAPNYSVKYFRGTTNITSDVVSGVQQTSLLQPGGKMTILVKVKVLSGATVGSSVTRLVTVTSLADGSKVDAVKFVGKRK